LDYNNNGRFKWFNILGDSMIQYLLAYSNLQNNIMEIKELA